MNKDFKNLTREDILAEAVDRCYEKMYQMSQPSISWQEIKAHASEEDPKHPFYTQHYLSNKDYKEIADEFEWMYNIEPKWKNYVDVVIDYLENGGTKDKYIEPKDGSPGYRGYEKVPALKEVVGKENAKKCIDLIKECRDFFRFDRDSSRFRFTVMNYSPCSNKKTVIDYWKSKGIELDIKDNIMNDDVDEDEDD